MTDVLREFSALERRVYHLIGNHCLYNFPRAELNARLGGSSPGGWDRGRDPRGAPGARMDRVWGIGYTYTLYPQALGWMRSIRRAGVSVEASSVRKV